MTDKVGYCYRIRSDSIMGEAGSVKRLDGVEGYLNRAKKFIEEKEWAYAEACLNTAKSSLLLGDFGADGKRSPQYDAVKRKALTVYRQMYGHLSFRRRVGILFFLLNEPLYTRLRGFLRKRENSIRV